ncbi:MULTISPECIES: hypothetical protein [unclassified Brevibacillus]|uniref:hypothetical protein n=1 Tax=unclassified Brevibacillus TaxID=2684853 RepID=UPI003569EA57
MGLSRSERNEDRRDARLERRQALEAKAQAEAKKSSITSSSAQQSNTNLSKSSVQKTSVDRVDISEAARNLAATVPKQAQTSNNTGTMHGPPIPPKTNSTQQSNTNVAKTSVQKTSADRVDVSDAARNLAAMVPKQAQTSNNKGVMHGPPIPPKTNSTQQSNTNAAKTSVQKTSADRVDVSDAARNLAAMVPKQAQTSNNKGVMHGPPIPPNTGKTWGEAGSEAAISAIAGTVVTTSVETGGQALLGNSSLPGPISKIIGLGVSTADVYYDAAANISKGDTKFGSDKSIAQSVTEAATGAIISELGSSALVNAIAVTPAYMRLTPENKKTTAIMAGLTTGYVISLADSKIGVSPGLAEYVEKEKSRVKESGKKINEYINLSNKKTYSDFPYKEKQTIDKYMNNVAFQNDRILKAKVAWEAANRVGDKDGKEKAKAVAKDAREKGGMSSIETTIDRIKELNDKILKEKNNYREAEKNKDKKAQDAARERANAYRTQGGTIR